ncbi:hypothetical protein STEG23_010381 [Scotinomys teguina]
MGNATQLAPEPAWAYVTNSKGKPAAPGRIYMFLVRNQDHWFITQGEVKQASSQIFKDVAMCPPVGTDALQEEDVEALEAVACNGFLLGCNCLIPVSSAQRIIRSGDVLLCSQMLQNSTWIDASCLTWEGQQFQGKAAIVEKLSSLPFQKIQHSITAQDHQPTPDSCIISMVVGQLKADEDPIMGFHQMFLLKNINDAWVCTNDMFRLALHNFG